MLLLVDRKSTRLNSSHVSSSYAVFCLKQQRTRRGCGPAAHGRWLPAEARASLPHAPAAHPLSAPRPTLPCLLLSLYRVGVHRVLHSFPTRRSSDLVLFYILD